MVVFKRLLTLSLAGVFIAAAVTKVSATALGESGFVLHMNDQQGEKAAQSPLVHMNKGPEAFALAVAQILDLPLGDKDPTPAMIHFIKRWEEEDLVPERWAENPLPREDWEPLVTALTTGVDISRLSRANAGDLNLKGEFGTVTRPLGGRGHYMQIPEALLKEAVRLAEHDPEAAAALAKSALLLDSAGTVSFVPTRVRIVASSPNRFFQFVEVAQLTDSQAADLRRLAREMQELAGIPQLKLMRLMDKIIVDGDGPMSDARLQEGARLSRELLLGKPQMMQVPQTAIDRISPVHEFLLLIKARNGEAAAEPVIQLVRTAQDRVEAEAVDQLLTKALDLSGSARQQPFIDVKE